jgi:plastocyanin
MTDHSGMSGPMISMKNTAFTPKDITVSAGEQVMVMNADSARHDLEDTDSKGKKFHTGDLDAGKSGMITAPSEPGDYPYFCKYHFGMEGVLHVK